MDETSNQLIRLLNSFTGLSFAVLFFGLFVIAAIMNYLMFRLYLRVGSLQIGRWVFWEDKDFGDERSNEIKKKLQCYYSLTLKLIVFTLIFLACMLIVDRILRAFI